MKILYPILAFYPSQRGGPSVAISWMVKALRESGVDTTVISTNYHISSSSNIKTDEWITNMYGKIIYCSYFIRKFPLRALLLSVVHVRRNDIIHLNSLYDPFDLIIGLWAALNKKVLVWAPSGVLDKEAIKYKRRKKIAYLYLFKKIFASNVVFHCSSPQESLDVRRIFGTKARMIEFPNYIELVKKLDMPIRKAFLFVGRINPIKAIENLILAVESSKVMKESDFILEIVGDFNNAYGLRLIELVNRKNLNDKVFFLGHQEGIKKHELYSSSYFLILPSHSENFGNVVTEALSQGTPVIASLGSPWEILETKKSGFWCKNDYGTLASHLDKVIRMSSAEYLLYREKAYEHVMSEYEVFSNIHKWVRGYQRLLRKDPFEVCVSSGRRSIGNH